MQAFDSTRHNHLLPIRSLLQSWWDNRPSDVIGLALYGSRAKNYAEQYSDWDIVILTSSDNPDEDAICLNLPQDYDDAPIHALCESVAQIESESQYGGSVLSAVVEQGVALFGTPIKPRSEKKLKPNYPSAETFLSNVLGEVHGFLSYSNFVRENGLKHHNASTKHSADAAEYLVKGLMSIRGINYKQIHNVKALCEQIEQVCPEDPIIEELIKLDGFTTKAHSGTYHVLFNAIEPIEQTNTRMQNVLLLLPKLMDETFDNRVPLEELKKLLSITMSNILAYVDHLTDSAIRKIVQQALDRIPYYLH